MGEDEPLPAHLYSIGADSRRPDIICKEVVPAILFQAICCVVIPKTAQKRGPVSTDFEGHECAFFVRREKKGLMKQSALLPNPPGKCLYVRDYFYSKISKTG